MKNIYIKIKEPGGQQQYKKMNRVNKRTLIIIE